MFLVLDLPYTKNDFAMKKNLVRLYPPCGRYGCAGKRNSFQKGRPLKLRLGKMQQLQDTSAKSRVFQGVDRWDDLEKVNDANYLINAFKSYACVIDSFLHFTPNAFTIKITVLFDSVLCGAKFESYSFWGICTESNKENRLKLGEPHEISSDKR